MNNPSEKNEFNWVPHLERIVNHALALDEETQEALTGLAGKVIGFHFINTSLTLYLIPTAQGLTIQRELDTKPHVMIKGTPLNFMTMMASGKDRSGVLPANMELIGDIGLAQRFQQIMQNMELDLEEPLSRWVGDTAAFQIGKFMRNTRQFALNTGKTLALDASEYLRFESDVLPDDLMVKEFCQDVATLREDTDRLANRLQKLASRLNSNRQSD